MKAKHFIMIILFCVIYISIMTYTYIETGNNYKSKRQQIIELTADRDSLFKENINLKNQIENMLKNTNKNSKNKK